MELQKLQNGLGEDLQELVEDGNTTHLWEQELFEQLQEYQTQIEALTKESVPVRVATDQEPTLPADFVRRPLDEALVELYDGVVGTSDAQVDGNIQPAREKRLAELVITKIETELDYGLSRSLGGAFELAEGNFAQKDSWLRVLKAVKSAVTPQQWERFTDVFRREILSLGVNLPPEDTYYNWLHVSDGLPYVRLVNDGSILNLTQTLVEGNWKPGEEIAGYNYRLENGFHLYELQPEASLPEGLQPRIAIAAGEVLTGVVPQGFVAYEALNLIDSKLYGALPVVLPTEISSLRDQALLAALAVGEAAEFQGVEPNVAYLADAVIEHLKNAWTVDLRQTLAPIFTGVRDGTYNADVWVHVLSRVRHRSGKYNRLLTSFRSEIDSLATQVSQSALSAWQRAAAHVPGGGPIQLAQALNSEGSILEQFAQTTQIYVAQLRELAPNILAILKTPKANFPHGDRVVLLAQELWQWRDGVPEPLRTLHNAVSVALYNRFTSPRFQNIEQLSQERQDQVWAAARWYAVLNPGDSPETVQARLVEEKISVTLYNRFQATVQQYIQEKGNEAAQREALQTLAEIQETFRSRFPNSSKNHLIRQGIQEITAERQQAAIAQLEATATPIQKNIHAIWIGGAIDATKISILEAWKTTNPDYTVNLWYDSDALLGNLLRRAIHTGLDQILPLPVGFISGGAIEDLSEEERVYWQQRKKLAAPIYDQIEEFVRLNGGGDAARASLLVERYREYLIQELKLSPDVTTAELEAAVETYRQQQQQVFTDLSSNNSNNLRLRDLHTEVLPSSQNRDFYRATLRLFGGSFSVAGDIAKVEILKAEGGLYTDLDFLPGDPLGDFSQPPVITRFLPINLSPNETKHLLNQGIPLLDAGMRTAHRGGWQITWQSDILQRNYQSYLKNRENIHKLRIRNFAYRYTAIGGVIAPSVRALGGRLIGPTFDKQSLYETLSIPERFFNQTPDSFVSSWEVTREDDLGSVEVSFEHLFQKYIAEANQLKQLLNTNRSALIPKQKTELEENITELQADLASVFRPIFWVAVKELSLVNPSTGRIISPQVEQRVFQLLDDLYQDVPSSWLEFDIRQELIQSYLRNELPSDRYPVEEVLSIPNAPNLKQEFVAELAASRIALDLATPGTLTGDQTILADYLETELRTSGPVTFSRLLNLLKLSEEVIQPNESLRTKKGLVDTAGLIGYSSRATGKGWAVYAISIEVEVLIDLETANSPEELNRLRAEATQALTQRSSGLDSFLHETPEVAGYRYRYSPVGVYNRLKEHVDKDFTPPQEGGIEAKLGAIVAYLAAKDTPNATWQPFFDDVQTGLIDPQLWSRTLRGVAQGLSPEAKLAFASSLGLSNLSQLQSQPSDPVFADFFTEEFLNQVAAFKLLDAETFNRELNAGNSEEVALILKGALQEISSPALIERLDTILTGVSQQPPIAAQTLATGIAQVLKNQNIAVTDRSRLYGALGAANLATLGASQPALMAAITEFSPEGALPEVYAKLVEGLPDSWQRRAGVKEDFVEALRYLQQDPNRDLTGALERTFTDIQDNSRTGLDSFVLGIVKVYLSLGTTEQRQFVKAVGLDNLQALATNGAIDNSHVVDSIAVLKQGFIKGLFSPLNPTLVRYLFDQGVLSGEEIVPQRLFLNAADRQFLFTQAPLFCSPRV